MIIGVPKEIKTAERRVAATPSGVKALIDEGHKVLVETEAGTGSGFPDEAFAQAGAEVRKSAAEVWSEAEMIIKVKEPLDSEFDLMNPGQIPCF